MPNLQGAAPIFPFKTSRRVLFGDCDPAGVIYTPRIAHFVVEAALEFLAHVLGGPAARMLSGMGVLPPARSMSIEFLLPVTWDERIEIEVSVNEVREHSFSLSVCAANSSGENTFRANLVQVCVSADTRRTVNLPPRLREALMRAKNSPEL